MKDPQEWSINDLRRRKQGCLREIKLAHLRIYENYNEINKINSALAARGYPETIERVKK